MQLQEHKNIYVSDEEIFSFQDTLLDNISFKVLVQCSTEKFLQYQKDILEEFVADFTNTIKTSEELDDTDVTEIFKQSLQLLNTKLKQFAEKVRDVERFQLKWVIQLVVDSDLISSMVWNVSMMILRDQKTTYSVQNNIDTKSKIDLFSDFIEWKLERDDQILYIGLKFADVMDSHDLKEMEGILAEEQSSESVLSFVEEIFLTRVEKKSIWFIISYFVQWPTIKVSWMGRRWLKLNWVKWKSIQYMSDLWDKIHNSELIQNTKRQLSENKIFFVWAILIVLIFIFVFALFNQIFNSKNNTNKFQTSSGAYVDINLDDIQADISEFKTLDASSSLKASAYNEISQKLDFLESQWKWLEDVADLRSQLQENYYDWFRVIQFKSDNELNTIAWRNTQLITFSASDTSKLWDLHSITHSTSVPSNMMIAWSKWALIDASSNTSRWTLIEYNLSKSLEDCITSIGSNGLYCYNDAWEIYMITKAWIVPASTEDWDFRPWIWWLGTYNWRSLYVFQSNVSSLWNMLLTRYQSNNDWTNANFKKWSSYSIAASWVNFGTFSSFAIDWNFFWWAEWKLYLFRREDTAGTSLNYRQINIKWWNPFTESYSDDVKVVTSSSTQYVFTFDKKQQLLTVYNTEKSKMNDENKRAYQLVYMFSMKFDIEWTTVYDIDIPGASGNRPELYLLTSQWVNKIALYEYIDAMN